MSTVPSSSSQMEAELSKVLNSSDDLVADPLPTSVTPQVAPQFQNRQIPASRQATKFASDAEILAAESLLSDMGLSDTGTFRLDDTMLEFPARSHLPATERMSERIQTSTNLSGTLALDPPSANGPLDGIAYNLAKRVLDVAISVTLLVLLSPVLLASAILVKLTDGGAIFYPHTRVGEGGNEFTCYKFRSMVVNAEQMKANLAFFNSHDDQRTFKIPDDPRVTWIGRWMRRTSVDELPQLWNVLKGDMSVVGPRPPVCSEVEQYSWDDMQRLAVKPGLTCIWQVSGRSRLPFPEQLRMDLEYIEKRSLALDLKLIALTVPAVLSADGAY